MNKHISSHFHQELETVRTEVMRMGGLVEQQLQTILQALSSAQIDALSHIINSEHIINELEIRISDDCQTIIARRQPTAGDLRFVLTVSRIIVDLERIGDELKKIAFSAHELFINNRITTTQLYDTHRLIMMAAPMLSRSLDAFARLDENALFELNQADHKLDLDYRNQSRALVTYMMEEPRNIGTYMEVMMMNKAIERIGDHAKNIAEHVVYLVCGINVRHTPLEQIKADLNESKTPFI